MHRKHYGLILFFGTCSLLISCSPDLKAPQPLAGKANFSRSIAIGGDFLAGYQDGALYMDGQNRSIPALLARVFQSAGGKTFRQALMPDNQGLGLNLKPWESSYVSATYLGPIIDCRGLSSLQPLHNALPPSEARPYLDGTSGNAMQNLSVPFAQVGQLFDPSLGLDASTGNKNPYYNRFAGNPGTSTVYSDAVNQHASFFTLWVGMEDIFNYAQNGGMNPVIASGSSFGAYLDTLLTGLCANGAKGVMATLPDFRSFPFYTLIPYNGAILTQTKADSLNLVFSNAGINNIHFTAGSNAFVIADPAVPSHYRQLTSAEFVLMDCPSDSLKCQGMGVLPTLPLPDRYVLTSSEVANIDGSIITYNNIIIQKAAQYGVALVDMHAYFNTVNSGMKWDGVNYNSQFITGGFYSLDGYHPNQKGYALLANEFVKVINRIYGSSLPTVNCPDCNGVLFP